MPDRLLSHPDAPGLSLAMAMITASTTPLLLIDGHLKVIAASESFERTFGVDPSQTLGREMTEIGDGEWRAPQLKMLLESTAEGVLIDAYEMDLKRQGKPDRRLVINIRKLAYSDLDAVRLLASVADVTEARAATKKSQDLLRANTARSDELAVENHALLMEIRHRVANSLQIIAAVLMQNARAAQSEEAREKLRDAHARVMSIADLQQQLAGATTGAVELRAYLTKLCATIAASMIPDPSRLALVVLAEEATIDAGASISIGLVVTELVINALKHAFPDKQPGRIIVDYRVDGAAWTLSVADTGVGMAKDAPPTAGLGSSIIQALARQLKAQVLVTDTAPGTMISLIHPAPDADGEAVPAQEAV
ncbi:MULTISPECIES: sensor histidine kinase [unclassified Caulobacter]|uniref:sensor histidine kinase n=2 Tax=Caulobacter TaxID=75 RepID=UPI0009EC651A|nr:MULTISPECIES: histidine kinase dimerization/phosphoacceptor domain -containing protein [unclassified Caulobacter]AZS23320.1 histidine kinase [Caulobacter sp. FWC26]